MHGRLWNSKAGTALLWIPNERKEKKLSSSLSLGIHGRWSVMRHVAGDGVERSD